MDIMYLGKQTVQKKRLALVLKLLSSNTSLTFRYIANTMNNLPFLVAAVLSNGEEQFLCPVVGEHKPRLQDVMCDLSLTSYKNKMVRTGIAGVPPYFIMKEQKIDGVDVKFLNFMAEKKSLQLNITIHQTFADAGNEV